MIRVIFRTCERVDSIHGVPRPFGLTKRQVIEACFKSLVTSLKGTKYALYIIGDEISPSLSEFFMKTSPNIAKITNTPNLGNAESLKQAFGYILGTEEGFADEDIVYLVEDDYLHLPEAVVSCASFCNKWDCFVHPTDYPDRYLRVEEMMTRKLIFLGLTGHFREIYNSTGTFMGKVKTFKKYENELNEFAFTCDDGKFSENVFRKTPLFSPLPGLATHMHEGVMPFYVDWKAVYEVYK